MAWLSVFVSLLVLFAVCRVTRFLTQDTLTQPLRDWIGMKAAPRHARPPARPGGRAAVGELVWRWADKLLSCPWCSGFWISAAAVLAYFRCYLGYWPHDLTTGFLYVTAVFACSWVSALLADWLDAPPPPREIHLHPAQLDVTTRQGPPSP